MKIEAQGTYLTCDGEPFFWLADTAWNAVLKATDEEFEQYLIARKAQGFNVIQFVCTHWRAYVEEQAFTLDPLVIDEGFFARRDRRVAMIREHGLIPAPVLLWALMENDPGVYLSEEDAIALARYIVDRWGGDPVVWFLGGDGHYYGDKAERWHRIGRGVFGDGERGDLVTMHPCGQSWVTAEFRHEPWFGFHGYQSGHGDSEDELRWLLNGPPERPGEGDPVQPIINLEPNYEGHKSYATKLPFDAHAVRRAAYWSLLVSPTAGVTYGNNSIWWWGRKPEDPLAHEWLGPVAPWQEGLDLPGIRSMTVLKNFFEALPWWELRPAQDLLAAQPGQDDPKRYVTVAATEDRSTLVAYLPVGGAIALQSPPAGLQARWFDPREGTYRKADASGPGFTAPDEQDWVLLLQTH
ncbi:MAG: DUF4038 domain-containing protein [Armatimonadota bacterium]